MAITRITTANAIPDSSVNNVKISNIVQSKNIIINGDMSLAQRGTSATGVGASDTYLIDRFFLDANASPSARFTMSQSTDVPTGQGFATSLKMDCTTAQASYTGNQLTAISQRFEGQNVQYLKYGTSSAQTLTLSFWVKSNKTGTYIAELDQTGNGRDQSQSYTISSANTWEKKTLTYTGDTASTLANDNTEELEVYFWLACSSAFTSGTLNTSWNSTTNANRAVGQVNLADSTSNEWYVTGVQLEAGTTASEFEFLPFDVNLQRCQRYYEKSYNLSVAPGTITEIGQSRFFYANTTSGYQGGNITFSVKKRTSATITSYAPTTGASGNANYFVFGSSTSVGSVTIQQQSERCFNYYGNGISCDSSGLQYTADAEL